VRYLVVSALHHESHPTHFNLEEALDFVQDIRPEKTWLTHLSHHMGLTAEVNPSLPEGVALAYDGLEIEF
jgi:phosphoribosyl 1,2-cyclic phosphate phosphodiesterase